MTVFSILRHMMNGKIKNTKSSIINLINLQPQRLSSTQSSTSGIVSGPETPASTTSHSSGPSLPSDTADYNSLPDSSASQHNGEDSTASSGEYSINQFCTVFYTD